MQDHGAAEARKRSGRLVLRCATVNHDREPELGGERELRLEQPALVGRRCELANRVESGLADGDRLRVLQQLAQLVEPPRIRRCGLVRIDAESREYTFVLLREHERGARRLDSRPDRHDPRDSRLQPALDRRCRLLARVEVRVRVGHADVVFGRPPSAQARRPRPAPRRASRTGAAAPASFRPAGKVLGSQRPAQLS